MNIFVCFDKIETKFESRRAFSIESANRKKFFIASSVENRNPNLRILTMREIISF